MNRGAHAVALFLTLSGMAAPASAGPPFLTDDPVPPELHTWEINSAAIGTRAGGVTALALPSIDANYGAAPGVQLHMQPQLSCIDGGGVRACGVGDTQLGIKYRFTAATGDSDA